MKIAKPIVFRNYDSTRASDATYVNVAGFVDTAGVNEPRFTYNPTTLEPIGPLTEGEATNFIRLNTVWTVSWQNTAFGTASGTIEITENPVINPDGSTQGYGLNRGTNPSFPSGGWQVENILTNPQGAGTYVWSVFVKLGSDSTDDTIDLRFFNGAPAAGFISIDINPGGTPAFYNKFPGTEASLEYFTASDTYRISVLLPNVYGLTKIDMGHIIGKGKIYFWGEQLEAGDHATSVIYTGSTAETRAADVTVADKPRVISSNVDEDDAQVWNDIETYVMGEKAMVLGQVHKVYSSIGTNTDKYPPIHPEEWIDEGATNRWRMFDMNVGSEKQTISTNSDNTINVLMDFATGVNTLILLNVYASSADIIMRDNQGNAVYIHHEEFLDNPIESGWWAYFFGARRRSETLVLTDLPVITDYTIEVLIDGDDQPALVGKLILGEAIDIGCARYGTGLGIIDFSRKERDPFGNNFILQRRYVSKVDYDVQIQTNRIDEIYNLLASLRATAAVYIGNNEITSTVQYGFYKDFNILINGPVKSDLTMQVESI